MSLPKNRVWIINGSNGEMEPGDFRARIVRDGPYSKVSIRIYEPRDENGDLIGDVEYEVRVDGRVVNYMTEFPQGLFGFYAEDFAKTESLEQDNAFDRKLHEQANSKSAPVDLMTAKLPF